MTRRECLIAGAGAGSALNYGRVAFAQGGKKLPVRKAKTTKLFKSPQGFHNGVSVTPEGLWIGEQKLSGDKRRRTGCRSRNRWKNVPGWSIGAANC